MAEQKLLLGNIRGPQGAAGPNMVSSSTTTSGFENGHVLFSNGGKVGAKKLTPSDVSALPATGTAEKAKKLTSNGSDFEAWKLQCLNPSDAPYEPYLFGQFIQDVGYMIKSHAEGELNNPDRFPVFVNGLQTYTEDGGYNDWFIRSMYNLNKDGLFYVYALKYGEGTKGCSVEAANRVISTSSIRNKEDIHPISDRLLDAILALDVIDFIYNKTAPENARDGKRHYGMIAEQVVKVMPDSVTLDREGLPTAVVYSDFIPLLLAQLQRQQKQMDTLEQRIRQLEEGNRE